METSTATVKQNTEAEQRLFFGSASVFVQKGKGSLSHLLTEITAEIGWAHAGNISKLFQGDRFRVMETYIVQNSLELVVGFAVTMALSKHPKFKEV